MIPTRSKAKIPKTMSFPLGAGAISESLAGAPHFDDLELCFSFRPLGPGAEFRRIVRERIPYRVMTVEFEPEWKPGIGGANDMVESGWYDEHWTVFVYPVLRELRHVAGELLRHVGIPAVSEWLKSSATAGWENFRHRIHFTFDPTVPNITIAREDGV